MCGMLKIGSRSVGSWDCVGLEVFEVKKVCVV